MKKPSQELVDAFFNYYNNVPHSQHEDHYKETITQGNLSGLTREQFLNFFNQFAREGGLVQSQGYRTAPMLMASIEADYDRFRSFIMEPFEEGFDEMQWLSRLDNFKGFGRGIATIYLNRVDKRRFAILNNKTANGMNLFGLKLPTDLTKRYQAVRDAQRQFIDWYPVFENFFRTDSLMHFLIGEQSGRIWAQQLSGAIPQKRYWLYAPGEQARFWDQYSQEGLMGVGWIELKEDMSEYKTDAALRNKYFEVYGKNGTEIDIKQFGDFLHKVRKGDMVFVKRGIKELVGLGEITSDYFYDPDQPEYRHLRKAEWQKKGSWMIPDNMKSLPVKTLTGLTDPERIKQLLTLIENDTKLQVSEETTNSDAVIRKSHAPSYYSLDECAEATGFIKERIASWIAAIERKKQAVFYGPPGTGKTFIAEHLARHIVGGTDGIWDCIQFHPAYTYEEFIQGIRPEVAEKGHLHFVLKSGRFLDFCARARQQKGPCVLIIDEINRANLARVFGELMYLLEYREKYMPLAGGSRFSIPENVRIIGTMNTADRSIALVDFALRRRFAFLELLPEYDVLLAYLERRSFNADGLIRVLRDVNTVINDKNFYLGISFFMTNNLSEKLEEIWKMEIEPYLEEYFFSQPESMSGFRWDRIKERLLT